MKKNVCILIMFILGMNIIQAKPITPLTAKNIAMSFYKEHSYTVPQTLTLAYTETSPVGEAIYYAFNVNANDGFVIVTADDAAHPIIGYSDKNQFVIPEANTTFGYWMTNRKKEIMSIKAAKLVATEDIVKEWAGDFSATNNLYKSSQRNGGLNSFSSSVAPLVQSTWNQNGGGSGTSAYNGLCPGGSVTGCVATAMAQIMCFWGYPTHGVGSSSYCDCTPTYSVNYGTLSANYGASTYSWTAMPLTSSNSKVAALMQNCGVSVDMNYSPSSSGAQVLSVDAGGGPCAQQAYTLYFAYNQYTIQGYQRTQGGYSDAAWLNFIETDLNAGRPVQYAGFDPANGGHTWVCDGYDVNNNLHMNWGWGGASDGYFSINNLAVGGDNFSNNHEILVGIQPPPNVDAGIANITKPVGVLCVSTFTPTIVLKNYGRNTLTTCTINYQITGGSPQTYNWTGSLTTDLTATVTLPAVTSTPGTYTITASTSNPNSSIDAYPANDGTTNTFIYATVGAAPPVVEGFEGSASLPAGWSTYDPNATDYTYWQVITNVGSSGTNCIGLNNCDGDGIVDMTGFKEWLYTSTYDFSSASSASLSFDVGYAPAYDSATPKLYTDSLAVFYSTNCGSTWNRVYYKGGANLQTAPTFTIRATVNCVAPVSGYSNGQWRTETPSISGVLGNNNVMFAFENISDYGNWIYIDNINITAVNTTGIASLNNNRGVMVYPNPAHDNLFINTDGNTSSYSVTDIIGQTVIAEQKVTPQQTQSIYISSLADGVYLVKVNSIDNQVKVIRFIKN